MGAQYTPSQKKAIEKYASTKSQMKITLTPEQKARYMAYAELSGVSMTKMICDLFEKAIEEDNKNSSSLEDNDN